MINPILTDYAARSAFDAFVSAHTADTAGLPWEIQAGQAEPVFMAGYAAGKASTFGGYAAGPVALPGVSGNYASMPDTGPTAADIYAAYPRKVGKQSALKAITKAAKLGGGMSFLLDKTNHYALAVKSWPAADKKFIPHPATWFNRGSYDDDQTEWKRGASAVTSQFSLPSR